MFKEKKEKEKLKKNQKAKRERKFEKKNLLALALSVFFFIFIFSEFASAVNVGVSPATLTFKNVLRGGYSHGNLVISADSQTKTNITVTALGNVSTWLNFTKNFSVSRDNPYILDVSATPPRDTPNGNYTGFLRIETSSLGAKSKGAFVGLVKSTLNVYVTIEVVDTQVIQCSASKYSVNSVEKGDNVIFNINITNTGNVKLKPRIIIEIWNEAQNKLLKKVDTFGDEILPSLKKYISIKVPTSQLDISQYWADVSAVDCLSSKLLTFDVLKPGALKANGVLLGILANKTAKVGDTVPIEATFKNIGEKQVNAEFKGQITKNGKIIQLLDSPVSEVEVGKIGFFHFYFTPKRNGMYLVSGRVYYSGKQTYESSIKINVVSDSFFNSIIPYIYWALIVVIIFLFLKILKEKGAYKRTLKRLGR